MASNEQAHSSTTAPGDTTGQTSTRQPTQLAVLLASAGTPPLEPEQARVASVRLWDGFVLSPERARLFTGDPRALFSDRPDVVDPRHDALARVTRTVAASLRQRLASYDATHPGAELIRGLNALESSRVEEALTGYDLRRGGAAAFSSARMLGPSATEVDPLEAADAGVLRRLVALTTRGLMVEKPGPRAGGVIADLGAVTLVLGLMDLFANPRSALRAARTRLAKASKLYDDDTARVRDVGQALREILGHAVSSATTSGAAGRDLVKETTLGPELFDHIAVALARAVYDGLAPREEHPLVVPGAGADERFTASPSLVSDSDDVSAPAAPGLYNRIGFVALPYSPGPIGTTVDAAQPTSPPRPSPRAMTFDDASFARVSDALRIGSRAARSTPAPTCVFEAQTDASEPSFVWRRGSAASVAARITGAAEASAPAVHPVILVGLRTAVGRELLDAISASMGDRWHLLVPRPAERTLCIEAIDRSSQAALQLRRADVGRWLDARSLRAIRWEAPTQCQLAIHIGHLEEPSAATLRALTGLIRDAGDRTDARAVLLLIGVGDYRTAAHVMQFLSRQIELETSAVPLRADLTWLVRTDAPMVAREDPHRTPDESVLADLAEPFATGAVADLAARTALLPADGRFRARSLRLAALAAVGIEGFANERKTLERLLVDPWSGANLRRGLLSGIAAHVSARAAIAGGLSVELNGVLRHELALMAAEWDRSAGRAPATRLADLARGLMLECIIAAHPRTALVADEAIARAVGVEGTDRLEQAALADAMHSVALGVRIGGSLYARDDSPGVAPFAVVLRGGPVELCAVVETSVGAPSTRASPAPNIEIGWKASANADGSPSQVGLMLAGLHAVSRTWTRDAPARVVTREGRSSAGVLLDLEIDAHMRPVAVRIVVPLRAGTVEIGAQRLAVEIIAHLAEITGSTAMTDWSARTHVDARGPTAVALLGPMLLRDLSGRWARALRILPRLFPTANKSNARYARGPVLATAAELGIAAAILQERNILPGSTQGRGLIARLPALAGEHEERSHDLSGVLPMKPSSQDGNAWEVLERNLAIAWFLHTNFCTHVGGRVQWLTADGVDLRPIVEQHIDRTAVRGWLARKTSRPDVVEQRMIEFLSVVEPSIVVGS